MLIGWLAIMGPHAEENVTIDIVLSVCSFIYVCALVANALLVGINDTHAGVAGNKPVVSAHPNLSVSIVKP